MAGTKDIETSGFTRREWLKRAGVAGAVAAVVPVGALAPERSPQGQALETLTADQAATLDAIVARLIPSDENGPGAREAGAARYIDRALGGALAASRDAYRTGLAAVDAHARTSRGASFAQLPTRDQDAVLTDIERNAAAGFTPNSSAFFTLVRAHTLQGTFGDPYYGGNTNFVGWDLIGYPGLRLAVGASDQRLDPGLTPTHVSAYDHAMFSPKPPRAGSRNGGPPHGD